MIAHLFGTISERETDAVVLDVAGVGYRVYMPKRVLDTLAVDAMQKLYTVHHVREDAMTLYGFMERMDRELFLRLQTVTGIGPRLALQMMSHMATGDIVHAMIHEQTKALTAVPGVGAKVAGRIVLELKDKVNDLQDGAERAQMRNDRVTTDPSQAGFYAELSAALAALGYAEREIERVLLQHIHAWEALPLQDALKAALRVLSERGVR
ncbi:Holliday junction branch migration protein RuvA [Ferroacidibacillus organovorans]|uniref:Holliday junction branch migration complex subunit RuvA n=1 Tax=Ferroacidibacillus organovorans TaxID=1765683 RepID=A0A1V4ESM8_9BACL|nr:Holliday junction branch migration protein RuvA [Ferroacidibacillus organovorans]OPG15943.1 Holliday junction branch migration protein RuvA [Ferroacidibacillus organovorans]